MKISVISGDLKKIKCDVLVVHVFEGQGKLLPAAAEADKALGGLIRKLISTKEISGKPGATTLIHCNGRIAVSHVLVAGLGKKEDLNLDVIRKASAAAVKACKKIGATKAATVVASGIDETDACRALCEASKIADHEFIDYKSSDKEEKQRQIEELLIIENGKKAASEFKKVAAQAMIVCGAVNKARDLVNMPSNKLTPTVFAGEAKKIATKAGLKCKVLGSKEIRAAKMGAIWAIAKGSEEEPKVVVMEYRGAGKSSPVLGIIGKGITFDSGGISLKPPKKMDEMKTDMAGAAAVLGVMDIIASLKPKKNVLAVIPLTENMPSGKALKPGDIVKTLSGKTVEIISTDAEGRMILADAITYAKKRGAEKLIDVATLTGACISALGDVAAGIVGNDQDFLDEIIQAAGSSGERLWQLPLYDEYRDYLKSTIADIKNCSDLGKAGTSTGGIFLKEFAQETHWAHIDIAGTAYLDRDVLHYGKGATGAGVFSIVNYLVK